MNELYLILHKVRGEPAYDIAHRLQIGDEQGWIIPTSGHRAHPYWWRALTHLRLTSAPEQETVLDLALPMPNDWPDHYTIHADLQRHKPGKISDLMKKLRLGPKLRMRGF
jgi:hypothetical protein